MPRHTAMMARLRTAAACLVTLALRPAAAAYAGLRMKLWNTTAFARGDFTYELITLVPGCDLTDATTPGWAGPFTSARLEGTLTPPATTPALALWVTVDPSSSVKLWVDDKLLVDSLTQGGPGAARYNASYSLSVVGGEPLPLRIEYIHASADPAVLVLSWEGGGAGAPPGVVPAACLAPTVRACDDARWAMRDRFGGGDVPWQTAWAGSVAAHVHVPSGLALGFTLGDTAAGGGRGALLGGVHVYPHSDPAAVTLGGHSWNGSDYTQLTVAGWKGRDCTVVFETATAPPVGGVGAGEWLGLASYNGNACGGLAAVLTPSMVWERVGGFVRAADNASVLASRPGFVDVPVYATGAPPVALPAAGDAALVLPFGAGGGAVGFTAGAARTLGEVTAAVVAARAAYAASRPAFPNATIAPPAELAAVYDGVASALVWNAIYTPADGPFAVVNRGWLWGGEDSLLFEWDTYFAAWMASGVAGPGVNATPARDLAFNSMLAVTLGGACSAPGVCLVQNVRNGLAGTPDRSEPQIGAATLARLVQRWGDDAGFLVDMLWRPLYSWHNWTYTRRRAAGSLAPPGGGLTDLYALGSDSPVGPPADRYGGTLQGARYESGQDNSPE